MGPIGEIGPNKSQLIVIISVIGIIGWGFIELIIWLFSFVTVCIGAC